MNLPNFLNSTEVEVAFQMLNYVVDEDAGSVEVCVVTNIGHTDPIILFVSSEETADAEGKDYKIALALNPRTETMLLHNNYYRPYTVYY